MARLPSVDITPIGTPPAGEAVNFPRGTGPSGVEGKALARAGDALFKATQRIRDRDDAVDRANRELELTDESVKSLEAFRRGADSPDISNNQILEQYNQEVMSRSEVGLAAHIKTGASQNSIARLRISFAKSESILIGKATFLSQAIALANLNTAVDRKISPIIEEVSKTPTIEVVDSALAQVADIVEDLVAITDPIEARKKLAEQQELIVETAFKTYMGRGHPESAEALVDQFSSSISNKKQAELRGKISTTRNTKSALAAKLATLRDEGIEPSQEEIKRMAGAVPTETDKDEFRANLAERGYSPAFSFDVSNGQVTIVTDQFGKSFQVNAVTGVRTPVSDADQKIIDKEIKQQIGETGAKEQPEEEQEFPATETDLEKAALQGVGIFSGLKAGISNTIGQLFAGTEFEDALQARQDLRVFNQIVKRAFVNNPRFLKSEQDLVTGFLVDPKDLAKDPAEAVNKLKSLEKWIISANSIRQKELDTAKITTKPTDCTHRKGSANSNWG